MQYEALLELDAATMNATLRPKVLGGWLLHRVLQDAPLDFFVMFSSASSLLNSPLIGSYAAANAFLDALAFYRKAQGQPALTVNWGPWAGEGMAVEFQANAKTTVHRGMRTIAPAQALAVLERFLSENVIQVAVMPVNWPEWQQIHPTFGRSRLLSELVRQEPGASHTGSTPELRREALVAADPVERQLLHQLQNTPPAKYRDILQNHVQTDVARILGLHSARPIAAQQPLSELGFDSLMAVDLANALSKATGRSLSATLVFKHPTVDAIVEYLSKDVLSLDFTAGSSHRAVPEVNSSSSYPTPDELSEREMAALLEKKLNAL
jgi:acyl carrier protein